MAKHNWPVIKAEYVEGVEVDGNRTYPSYSELAEKHGVRADVVRRRAAADKWLDERHIFAAKVSQARQEKKVEVLAKKGAEFDAKALRANEVIINQVTYHLGKAAEAKQPLPLPLLEKAAATIERAHKSGRLALGDTTENPQQPPAENNELTESERAARVADLLERARARRAGQTDGAERGGTETEGGKQPT